MELEEQFAIALYSEKTQLNTPEILDLNGSKLSWNAVEHANSYTLEIQICNEETTTLLTVPDIENTTYDLTEAFLSSETRLDGGKYAFRVEAVASEESEYTESAYAPVYSFFVTRITLNNYDKNGQLKYDYVIGEVSEEKPYTLPIPKCTGYNFDGWQVGESNTVTQLTAHNTEGGYTLTATWVAQNVSAAMAEPEKQNTPSPAKRSSLQ